VTYSTKEREILDQVVAALHGHYGKRLSRVVLFGSRARRDHHEYSDYDILVVLHGEFDISVERKEVVELIIPIDLTHDVFISCLIMPERRFTTEDSILLRNVRAEGVPL